MEEVDDGEQQLSQKLSQISTHDDDSKKIEHQSSPVESQKRPLSMEARTVTPTKKRIRNDPESEATDQSTMPQYLSPNNPLFEQYIQPILTKTAIPVDVEYLRKIAFLLHQLGVAQLDVDLWRSYLASGTDHLYIPSERESTKTTTTSLALSTKIQIQLWPKAVKTAMESQGIVLSETNEQNQQTYLDFVYAKIRSYRNQMKQYQDRIHRMRYQLHPDVDDALQKFVDQHGLDLLRIPNDGLIATVNFDYHEQSMEVEFQRMNPNARQREIFKNLIHLKSEHERSKVQVNILKQRLVYQNLPKTFASIQLPIPDGLEQLKDRHQCQRLVDRQKKIIERAKSEAMLIHIEVAETKMLEARASFDYSMNRLRETQSTRPEYEILSDPMLDLMERRFRLIHAHLQQLYDLKIRFFGKAPTAKN